MQPQPVGQNPTFVTATDRSEATGSRGMLDARLEVGHAKPISGRAAPPREHARAKNRRKFRLESAPEQSGGGRFHPMRALKQKIAGSSAPNLLQKQKPAEIPAKNGLRPNSEAASPAYGAILSQIHRSRRGSHAQNSIATGAAWLACHTRWMRAISASTAASSREKSTSVVSTSNSGVWS